MSGPGWRAFAPTLVDRQVPIVVGDPAAPCAWHGGALEEPSCTARAWQCRSVRRRSPKPPRRLSLKHRSRGHFGRIGSSLSSRRQSPSKCGSSSATLRTALLSLSAFRFGHLHVAGSGLEQRTIAQALPRRPGRLLGADLIFGSRSEPRPRQGACTCTAPGSYVEPPHSLVRKRGGSLAGALSNSCIVDFAYAVRGAWATFRATPWRGAARGGVREIGPTHTSQHVHCMYSFTRCSRNHRVAQVRYPKGSSRISLLCSQCVCVCVGVCVCVCVCVCEYNPLITRMMLHGVHGIRPLPCTGLKTKHLAHTFVLAW